MTLPVEDSSCFLDKVNQVFYNAENISFTRGTELVAFLMPPHEIVAALVEERFVLEPWQTIAEVLEAAYYMTKVTGIFVGTELRAVLMSSPLYLRVARFDDREAVNWDEIKNAERPSGIPVATDDCRLPTFKN